MTSRLGVAGLLAASMCFALLPACGGDEPPNNGADAGTNDGGTNDGGTNDGGPTEVDKETAACPTVTDCSYTKCNGRACGANNAGSCENLTCQMTTGIGDSCSGPTAQKPQGSCSDASLACNQLEYVGISRLNNPTASDNTCTKACTSNAECGTTNGVANACAQISSTDRICIPGCTENGNECGQDKVCVPYQAENRCLSTCAANDACQYGLTCVPFGSGNDKICNPEVCPSNKNCGAGRICDEAFKSSSISGLCVDECTATSCPSGLECDATTKTCGAPQGNYYNECTNNGQCDSGASCVAFSNGSTAVCIQSCMATGLCGGTPANTECAVTLSEQTNGPVTDVLCVVPCIDEADCPDHTFCTSVSGGSQPSSYCLPK